MSDPTVDEAQAPAVDLTEMPGHLIRRLQQIAVAAFLQESEAFGLTPVQFAALQAICTGVKPKASSPRCRRWRRSRGSTSAHCPA